MYSGGSETFFRKVNDDESNMDGSRMDGELVRVDNFEEEGYEDQDGEEIRNVDFGEEEERLREEGFSN